MMIGLSLGFVFFGVLIKVPFGFRLALLSVGLGGYGMGISCCYVLLVLVAFESGFMNKLILRSYLCPGTSLIHNPPTLFHRNI